MKALVTGAAAGLGHALTLKLAAAGYQVLAIDRDSEGLSALDEHASTIGPARCDLTDTDALAPMIAQWAEAGPFDRVILNAGISATGHFEKIPAQAHEKVLAVNAIAPMLMASMLARLDAFSHEARLVFISSLSHKTGYPGASSYAASKDALAVYAKSISGPFAKRGIHVTRVFPGPIRTGHAQRHAPAGSRSDRRMSPEELAGRILRAAERRKRVLYPGLPARLSAMAGTIAPDAVTRLMRRHLFDRLDREVW